MQTIKKIMVPIAFSPYSQGIVDYAAMLARSLDVEKLIFINIINERDVEAVETIASFGYKSIDEEQYVEEIQKQRSTELDVLLESVDFPPERMKLIMAVGNPAQKILQKALKEEVDMIIMGLKAKSELLHVLTGSVAEKLFRRSPITIVSYRDENIAKQLRKRIHE
jgi:nucleotide-binding universal stress UspA family protein